MGESEKVTAKRCVRCGRPARSARALATGYGERCRRVAYRAARLLEASAVRGADKAALVLRDGGVLPHPHPGVVRVLSTRGDRTYLAHHNGCTCDAGIYQRACYHRLVPVALAA
jgi:hypothetical protein